MHRAHATVLQKSPNNSVKFNINFGRHNDLDNTESIKLKQNEDTQFIQYHRHDAGMLRK